MAASVTQLNPVKLPQAPTSKTPEQTYWRSFKSQQLIPSPANNPITHISHPSAPFNGLTGLSDYFAATTGPRVQLYSVKTGRLLKTISRFDDIAHGADIRRDGRVMVAGDETGVIQVFDIGSRAILKTWKEHKQPVWTTKFSPYETTTLLSASDDHTVRLWDLPSQESTTTFSGHQDYVRSAAFLGGKASGLIVSGSYDQTVKLWDPRAPASSVMTFKLVDPVETVMPMPTGTTICAAAGNRIAVLDIVAGRPLHILENHQKAITSLSLASNDTRVISGGLDGHVKIFETLSWNSVAGFKYPSPVLSLAIISTGSNREDRHLAVGLQSGVLSVKTRLSGQAKTKQKERDKEMKAMIDGDASALDKKRKREELTSGWRARLRGKDFTGESADIVIEGARRESRKKVKPWEQSLRKGKYADALDKVLAQPDAFHSVLTLLIALRHRSALRTALSGRDETTLQPILRWTSKHIIDTQYVPICVDISILILNLYGANMGQSQEIDFLIKRLHSCVRQEVNKAQQAWQTEGMMDMLIPN
ncbi:hypothetical protein MMC25_003674 [Agyrium rufum]|nr:hypothetical protein [Agyrium rufum]